jgi:hypothetical protein
MLSKLIAAFLIVLSFFIASLYSLKICFWCVITRALLWCYLFSTTYWLGLGLLLAALGAASMALVQSLNPALQLCPLSDMIAVSCYTGEHPGLWGHSFWMGTLACCSIILLIGLHHRESA